MFHCPTVSHLVGTVLKIIISSVVSRAGSVAPVSAGLFLTLIAANVVLNSLLFIDSCPRQMSPLKGDEQTR